MVRKLEELLVDERALDREALGEGLLPYIRVSRDGTLRPAQKWSKLNKGGRVLAVLLGAKAGHVLEVRTGESLSAQEVAALSGVPGNTSRPILRGLLQRTL